MNRERRIIVIQPNRKASKSTASCTKLRVAAYCRVSTEEEEQQGSFEIQKEFYTAKINSTPEWQLAGIYADDGISGVHTKKRDGFNQMIQDCKKHKIDLILTKSISRFARNTVDSIQYVRMLKQFGVTVIFEKENINTSTMNSEMLLTVLSAFAQAESESISQNISRGKRMGFSHGRFSFPYAQMLGYRKGADGQPEIIPEHAELIRMIYTSYLHGDSLQTIKGKVEAGGYKTVRGNTTWSTQALLRILQNEKYCGDVLLQKTFTDNVLTGAQLDEMTDSALSAAVEEVHVFAELTPGQKVRLVAALEQNGHTVGFLGDGINDIPALCEANVGISVDTAVDAAKDAADVVLLQKDLGVLEEGILEGRKTFTNMLKYIKITASSNFGNILSIVCASAFLPFLPMTSLQLLLLNLLYDALCIILPWDNVDEEETLSPRDWSGRTLGRFMLSFGSISSVFDIATFLFLYYVLCPALCGGVTYPHLTDPALRLQYVALFQTGWFLESMWTQVLILHFLRTRRIPFVQSRPSAPVMVTTLAGIVVFTGLTFTTGGGLFGLTRLPLWYFGFLLVVALAYMLLTTVVKTFYQKKHHQLI